MTERREPRTWVKPRGPAKLTEDHPPPAATREQAEQAMRTAADRLAEAMITWRGLRSRIESDT